MDDDLEREVTNSVIRSWSCGSMRWNSLRRSACGGQMSKPAISLTSSRSSSNSGRRGYPARRPSRHQDAHQLSPPRDAGAEEDHLTDRGDPGKQHHEPVDADPETTARRQPVLERPHVILVDVACLDVAGSFRLACCSKRSRWSTGSSELAEGVAELTPGRRARKRSTSAGSSRCVRASGDTSRG
jgi:hypothetical protein